MLRLPLLLRLPRRALARRDVVQTLLARLAVRPSARTAAVGAFAFKDDELSFARELAARTHLWLYRVNQRVFAGDFVVVDVSCPLPERRRAVALDLKRGQRVRAGRPGVQMMRADRAVASLAAQGIVGERCAPAFLTGDARAVLASIDDALR